MSQWKSTLGKALRDEDEQRIIERWRTFFDACATTKLIPPDPVEMLDQISNVIIEANSLRTAINEAWFQANKVIGQSPPRKRDELEALISGLTDEQIIEAIKGSHK